MGSLHLALCQCIRSITNGVNSFLVDNSEEAIERIKEIDYINRIDCRKVVEKKFTKEIMVKKYIEVYNKILS